MKVQISLSAVPIKAYFNYLKRKGFPKRFENSPISRLYADMFKQCAIENKVYKGKPVYRLYYPLGHTEFKIKEDPEVVAYVESNGFEVLDYTKGFVIKKGDKRERKIGGVLSKNKELLIKYNDQKSKHGMKKKATTEKLTVVISRHPYDFIGMSTDRAWKSCTRLGLPSTTYPELDDKDPDRLEPGLNVEYLLDDVESGSLIAYLVKHDDEGNDDDNISKPIARMRILRYTNGNDWLLKLFDRVYPTDKNIKGFSETVEAWTDSVNPKQVEGAYCAFDTADTRRKKVIGDQDVDKVLSWIKDPESAVEIGDEKDLYGELENIVSYDDVIANIYTYVNAHPEHTKKFLNAILTSTVSIAEEIMDILVIEPLMEDNVSVELVTFLNKYLVKGPRACYSVSAGWENIIRKVHLDNRARSIFYRVIDLKYDNFRSYKKERILGALTGTRVEQNNLERNKELFHNEYVLNSLGKTE